MSALTGSPPASYSRRSQAVIRRGAFLILSTMELFSLRKPSDAQTKSLPPSFFLSSAIRGPQRAVARLPRPVERITSSLSLGSLIAVALFHDHHEWQRPYSTVLARLRPLYATLKAFRCRAEMVAYYVSISVARVGAPLCFAFSCS